MRVITNTTINLTEATLDIRITQLPKRGFDDNTQRWTENRKSKLFVWDKREANSTDLTNFENRLKFGNAIGADAKARVAEFRKLVLPTVFKILGEAGKNAKANWSSKCGCSMCPCSPGFNLNNIAGNDAFEIHVTIKQHN